MSDISFDPAEGHPQRRSILAVLCLSLVLIVASVSSLNVAIPTIVEELGATQTQQLWIVDAYSLVFAGLLLPAGALGDRFGRKGALLGGMSIFAVFAILASFMDSADPLIVLRAGMGVGAALIMPATLSIITAVFPPSERGQAIAVWAGFAGAGGAIGPLASGLLLDHFWWGSVFFINVPIVAVAMALIARLVPTSRDTRERALDLTGAALSIVGLGSLVFGIIEGPEKGWTSSTVLAAFAVAVLGIVCFVFWELRHHDPMLDPRHFRNRSFTIGAVTITMSFAVMFGMFYVLTLYLQFVLGHSALGAAVRTLPFAATMIVVSPRAPRLAERFGRRSVVVGGILLQACGFAVASTFRPGTSYPWIVVMLLLLASGMALLMPPSTEAIVSSLPLDKAGVGSAVNDTTREVGGAIGIALLGSLLSQGYRDGMGSIISRVPEPFRDFVNDSIGGAVFAAERAPGEFGSQLLTTARDAFSDGLHTTFLTAAGVSVVTAAIVWTFHPRGDVADPDTPVEAAAIDT